MTDAVPHAQSGSHGASSRARQVVTWMVFGALNALGLLLATNLWWLRLSGRLAHEVDAPEIVLLYAVVTGVLSLFTLVLAALAVKVRWLATWWVALPAIVLVAAVIGVFSVAGDL